MDTVPLVDTDQYLILDNLLTGASQRAKLLQQSKARSHAAVIGHRKARSGQPALSNESSTPVSRIKPRRTWTAVYRSSPPPQQLRRNVSQKSGDVSGSNNIENGPNRDLSEQWRRGRRLSAGPQSLLSATDPFATYPVSTPTIRHGQLLDFGKSLLVYGLISAPNGQNGQLSTMRQP
jgi:hypothetical protein